MSPVENSLYAALSYVWGDPEHVKTIIVNGCDFAVTESLYSALQHIPLSDLAPAVFIDAICIDQASPTEKTEQVQLMSSIFTGATCVFAWLGLSTKANNFIIDVMIKLTEIIED